MTTAEATGTPPRAAWPSLWEVVKIARPGLCVAQLWFYALVLLAGWPADWTVFWVGAFYATLPVGLIVYGWNDYFDQDVDAISDRKHNAFIEATGGARVPPERLRRLPWIVLAIHLPFLIAAGVAGDYALYVWFAIMLVLVALYSTPGVHFSRVPVVAETFSSLGYVSLLWLSAHLGRIAVPWELWVLAVLTVLVYQIVGAACDLSEDRVVGKRTLAVVIGDAATGWLLAALLVARAVLAATHLGSPVGVAYNVFLALSMGLRVRWFGWPWGNVNFLFCLVADAAWLLALILWRGGGPAG